MWKSTMKVKLLWIVLSSMSCVSSQLLDKTGCNLTISCYSQPTDCTSSQDCEYLLKYSVQNNGIVDFSLSSNIFEWIAVGFNPDAASMDGGESLACELYTNEILLRHYINMSKRDLPTPSQDTKATLVSKNKSGNILSCRIQRKLDLGVKSNLKKPVYFLYAAGMVTPKNHPVRIKFHRFYRTSAYRLNVFDVSDNTDTSKAVKRIDTSQCGKSLGCLRTPSGCHDNRDCDYLLTFRKNNSSDILFSLSGKSDGWVSVGFNDRPKMGGTDAVICQAKAADVVFWVANLKYDTPKLQTPSEARMVDGKFEGGIIYCSFTRHLNPKSKNRVAIDIPRYVIYAKGKGVAELHEHEDEDRGCSVKKVDFGNHIIYDLGDCGGGLEKVHGSFMIFAWMFLVVISIFIARYSRSLWMGLRIFGSDAWFQFHRLIMGIAVLFTIIAITIIFVDKEGWSESAGVHAKLGITVLVLAIMQPTIAFFRPHPRKTRRVLFNWFHRILALFLAILAVVTVFKGTELLEDSGGDTASKCVIALLVIALVTALVMEFLAFRIRAKSSPNMDLATETMQEENSIVAESFWETKIQRVLLVVFSLVVFILAVVMIAYVAGAGDDDDDDDD